MGKIFFSILVAFSVNSAVAGDWGDTSDSIAKALNKKAKEQSSCVYAPPVNMTFVSEGEYPFTASGKSIKNARAKAVRKCVDDVMLSSQQMICRNQARNDDYMECDKGTVESILDRYIEK